MSEVVVQMPAEEVLEPLPAINPERVKGDGALALALGRLVTATTAGEEANPFNNQI